MLSLTGITPKNGWIADHPVTPIIVGELQSTLAAAADAQKLPMRKDEALKAFQDVTAEFGLSVVSGGPGQVAEDQPQPNPTVINNYYDEEGPPIVTYYPPPWDYDYLYSWVPYPFWCTGFFFPGFFILHDFHRSIFIGHHHHFITNHFIDPKTHAVRAVDPTTRTMGRPINASLTRTQGFRSPESRRAATSIFNRSFSRTATSRGTEGTISRGITGRGMNGVGNTGRQNGMNFRQGQNRSFNTPNLTHERSLNSPLRSAGVLDPLETSEGLSALEADLSALFTVLSGALMEVVSRVERAALAAFPAEAIAPEASVAAIHPVVSPAVVTLAVSPVAEDVDNDQN
jgi:hypothetical protein